MAEAVERLYKLVVDGTSAARQLEQIAGTAGRVDSAMSKVGGAFRALLAGASVGAVVAGVRGIVDGFDALSKSAQAAGVSVETLSGLSHAASMSGVETEKLGKALSKLSVALDDANRGNENAVDKLRELGVAAGDDVDTALAKMADRFAAMPDGAQKTALAVRTFGEEGRNLIPMLNAGAAGLEAMREEARALGLEIDGDAARAAEAFNDNLARMAGAVKGAGSQFVVGFVPALQAVTDAFTDTNTKTDLWKTAGEGAGEVARWVAKMFAEAGAMVRIAGSAIGATAAAVATGSLEPFRALKEDVGGILRELDEQKARIAGAGGPSTPGAKPTADGDTGAARAAKNREVAASVADLTAAQKALIESHKELSRLEAIPALVAAYDELAMTAPPALAAVAERLRDQLLGLKEATPEVDAYVEAGARLAEQMKASSRAAEVEAAQLQILVDWFESGTQAQRDFAAQMLASTATVGTQAEKIEKTFGETLRDSVEGWSRDASNAILDFATGAERDVGKMVDGVLKQFARLALQTAMNPFFKQFGDWLGGMMPTASTGAGAARLGAAGAGGELVAFSAAPAFDLPRLGSPGMAAPGGRVVVNVNNYADAKVEARESTDANGDTRIDLIIERTVADGLGRGRFDGVLGAAFGVQRKGR